MIFEHGTRSLTDESVYVTAGWGTCAIRSNGRETTLGFH